MVCSRRTWSRVVVAVMGSLALTFVVACSSAPPKFEEMPGAEMPEVEVPPSTEVEPYLVAPSAGVIVKARPGAWHRVRPVVERLVAGSSSGGEGVGVLEGLGGPAGSRPEASARSLQEVFGEVVGGELELEHLAVERPAYLVVAPHRHGASQGCLSAGLPCVLMAPPGPRFGRWLLPSEAPEGLAAEIREQVGEGAYETVVHDHHVRVEFATGTGVEEESGAVDEQLEVRSRDRPVETFVRRTPARAALLDEEVPFGVYLDLRAGIDAAMYLGQWRLYRRMQQWSADERMARVLAGTQAIGALADYDAGKAAEVEDVAFLAGGDGAGSHTLDLVSTRTTRGRQLERVGATQVALPEVTVGEPAVILEWSRRLDRLAEMAGRVSWARTGAGGDLFGGLGGWGLVGVLRAPNAVAMTLAEAIEARSGGFDPTRMIAGRVRLSEVREGARGIAGLRGGGVVRLAAGAESEAVVRWCRAVSRVTAGLAVDVTRREEGTIDVRFGLGRPVDEVVGAEADGESVARLAMRADSEAVARLADVVFGRDRTASQRATARVVGGLAERGGVRLSQVGTDQWANARMALGQKVPQRALAIEPVEFSTRQPRADCLGGVASMTGDLIERALASGDPDAFLDERLSTQVARFRNSLADCGGAGEGEQELAQGAIEYFDAWYALVEYRTGSDVWEERIGRICEAGHGWACDPPTGEWPWVRRPAGEAVGRR